KKKDEILNPIVLNKLKIDAQSDLVAWLRAANLLKIGALKQLSSFFGITYTSLTRRINNHTDNDTIDGDIRE
ncbi:MAG: hypothetical protein V1831_03250, partial [Candidatus Woesearchaeota archaeon]